MPGTKSVQSLFTAQPPEAAPAGYNELFSHYLHLLRANCEFISQAGYNIEPYAHPGRSLFPKLDPQIQDQILAGLKSSHALAISAQRNGVKIVGDSLEMAWWTMRSLRLRPLSDLFGFVQPGDTLEIYDVRNVQIFRSFNVFRCISYSLDELVTYSWNDLYTRPAGIEELLLSDKDRACREKRTVTDISSPTHVVGERFSTLRRQARYETRAISPLLAKDGEIAGYVNVIRATPLTEITTPLEAQL